MSRPPVDSKPSIATARNTGWMLAGIVLMGIVALRLTVDSLADISRLGALDPSRAMDELVMLVRWVAGLGLFVMTCGGLMCVLRGIRFASNARDNPNAARRRANGLIAVGTFLLCLGGTGFVVGGM